MGKPATNHHLSKNGILNHTDDWWVAYTKPRHEKALARDLAGWSISYYLPLYEKIHRRPDNGKPRKAHVPLFPCYVPFIGIANKPLLFQTNRVRRILPVWDKVTFVQELNAIARILASDGSLQHVSAPTHGDLVHVCRGPLTGITGRLEEIHNHHSLIIGVEMLRGYISITIAREDVEILR